MIIEVWYNFGEHFYPITYKENYSVYVEMITLYSYVQTNPLKGNIDKEISNKSTSVLVRPTECTLRYSYPRQ